MRISDWSSDVCSSDLAGPRDDPARDRLAYDEIFASQVALMLIREGLRARKGRAIAGDGRLTDALQLPFGLTGAQLRVGREIAGDMAQDRPLLRMLQGDRKSTRLNSSH